MTYDDSLILVLYGILILMAIMMGAWLAIPFWLISVAIRIHSIYSR